MDTLSASKLDRAAVCPASFALPCVFEPSSRDATKGTEFHATMRGVANATSGHGFIETVPGWCLGLMAELSNGADRIYAERCFAYDPRTGYGRDLETHDRDYSGLHEGEIGGTIDLLVLRGKTATVYDYKTGFLGADIDTAQLAHNALAVASAYGLESVEVALVIVDLEAESYYVKSKALDVFALASEAGRLTSIVNRVDRARARFAAGDTLDVTESDDGCRYCPCRQSCPAKTQAISLVLRTENVTLPTAEELLANATPGRAAQAWVLAKALEELAGNVRRIVSERAQFERLPLPDGSYLTAVAVEREGIADVDAAVTALRPMLGDAVDGAVVTTRKLTKGAIEALAAQQAGKGGGAKAKRAAVEILRTSGALKTTTHYEVKRKEALRMAINIAVLEGVVGKDATVRSVGGDEVCGFSISLSNGKNKDGSWKDSTWVEVSYWGKYAAEKADRLRKGARATVTGRIGLRRWEKDGKSGVSLELRASDVSIHEALPAGGQASAGGQRRGGQSYGPQGTAGRDDADDFGHGNSDSDLPF